MASTKYLDNEIENLTKEMMEYAKENDGELTDEHLKRLESLEDAKLRVVEETVINYKALKAKEAMFKAQIKGLKEEMDSIGDEATTLAKTIGFMLDGDTYSSATSIVKYGNSTKTVFSEAIEKSLKDGVVPKGYEEYCESNTIIKMPKKALKEAIEAGKKFKDVKVVKSSTINIK